MKHWGRRKRKEEVRRIEGMKSGIRNEGMKDERRSEGMKDGRRSERMKIRRAV